MFRLFQRFITRRAMMPPSCICWRLESHPTETSYGSHLIHDLQAKAEVDSTSNGKTALHASIEGEIHRISWVHCGWNSIYVLWIGRWSHHHRWKLVGSQGKRKLGKISMDPFLSVNRLTLEMIKMIPFVPSLSSTYFRMISLRSSDDCRIPHCLWWFFGDSKNACPGRCRNYEFVYGHVHSFSTIFWRQIQISMLEQKPLSFWQQEMTRWVGWKWEI